MHKAPAGRAFPPASPGSRTGKTLIHADCPFLMRFTAAWVYVAMATAGVSLLEKQKDYETACDLLRQLLGMSRSTLICLWLGRLCMPEQVYSLACTGCKIEGTGAGR